MMSRFRWAKSGPRMCSMFASEPVSRLSTQITRCPRESSSSHRWEPRKPAPPVTRVVGIKGNLLRLGATPSDEVLIPAADRELVGVEVLEQRLGELARGA